MRFYLYLLLTGLSLLIVTQSQKTEAAIMESTGCTRNNETYMHIGKPLKTGTHDACAAKCNKSSNCVSWTWNKKKKKCYLIREFDLVGKTPWISGDCWESCAECLAIYCSECVPLCADPTDPLCIACLDEECLASCGKICGIPTPGEFDIGIFMKNVEEIILELETNSTAEIISPSLDSCSTLHKASCIVQAGKAFVDCRACKTDFNCWKKCLLEKLCKISSYCIPGGECYQYVLTKIEKLISFLPTSIQQEIINYLKNLTCPT